MDLKAVEIYKRLAKLPLLLSANVKVDKIGNYVFESFWEQVDVLRQIKIIFRHLQIKNQDVLLYQDTNEINNELWRARSHCGSKLAILRKSLNEGEKFRQHIEIWSKLKLLHIIDLHTYNKHGNVYSEDEIFASFSWSSNGNYLIYIAEKKQAKTSSFFVEENYQEKIDGVVLKGNEYEYIESWGEQMGDKNEPVICLLNLNDFQIHIIDYIPNEICPAQAKFIKNDEEIIFIGYVNQPKRLGIIYCPNRESYLCKIILKNKKFEKLTANGLCIRSPVPSPDGKNLVFLENHAFGPHHPCSRLMLCDLNSSNIVELIDVVENYKYGEFAGIYLVKLNDNCWSLDGKHIYFSTNCGSRMQLFSVNILTKQILNLSDASWLGDFEFMDIKDSILLAAISSPIQPHHLVYGMVNKYGLVKNWTHVQDEVVNFNLEMTYNIVQYNDCEYILYNPCNIKQPPLILVNHGGPHSAFTTSFNRKLSGFCLLQYAVLLVNYKGSIGFGNARLASLAGNIGKQEILETQLIVEEVIKSGAVDPNAVFVTGGSHGGFITLHLIAQYPNYYKAAVVRNPVFNIAALLDVSDIPDWAYYECGINYNISYLPTPSTYELMLAKSPISLLNQIKSPTLIMLGGKDQRVPSSQGLACHHYLKANNVNTKVKWYKDSSHALSEVPVDSDQFIHIVLWFQQFK